MKTDIMAYKQNIGDGAWQNPGDGIVANIGNSGSVTRKGAVLKWNTWVVHYKVKPHLQYVGFIGLEHRFRPTTPTSRAKG